MVTRAAATSASTCRMFQHGRERLGNENDTYMELTWMQAHMLGDSPDVMDVSMTFTPAIRYVQSRNTFTGKPWRG